MPENYYCLDNFFHKLTDMESPRKNNDCYFYYYSTCTKGDSCTFRHEPSALGCETTCSFWKEGKCFNVQCNFRHMELRKNRKVIPCYWETQPGGCLKPHCPFLHQNPKHMPHSENQGEASDIKSQEINKQSAIQKTDSCAKNASQANEKSYGNPVVDPLVVNFEEESDNESAPTQSPVKTSRSVKVKTLEEIRLEKVQAESAAYYSYPESNLLETNDDLRETILRRMTMRHETDNRKDFNILSLKEIRRKRKFTFEPKNAEEDGKNAAKKQKMTLKKSARDISDVKIKTLEEIRAERARKTAEQVAVSSSNEIKSSDIFSNTTSSEESEVSSTSKTEEGKDNTQERSNETVHVAKVHPIKRLKRTRSTDDVYTKQKMLKLENDGDTREENETSNENEEENICDKLIENQLKLDIPIDDNTNKDSEIESQTENETRKLSDTTLTSDVSKIDDLLLEEEDFEEPVNIKAEEDILKDIDELLND